MRILLTLAVVGVLILLTVIAIFQRRLIYFPSHEDQAAQGTEEFPPLRSASGDFLGYFREARSTERVVLFFHGNGGEAIHRMWLGSFLDPESVTIVLAEYPGYGGREGMATEAAIQEAALEVFDVAQRRWSAPVTVLGESLGSGVASLVAAHRPIDRLALISPFTSLADAARIHYPYLPVQLLLRDRFASDELLKDVQVPLHIIHGTADIIVPFALGQKLYNAYSGQAKAMTQLSGIGHNDIATPIVNDAKAEQFRAFVAGSDIPAR